MITISLPNDIPFTTVKLNKSYITSDNKILAVPYISYIKITNSYNYTVPEYQFYFIKDNNDTGEFQQQNSQDDFTFIDSKTNETIDFINDLFDKQNNKLRFILKIKNLGPNETRYIKYTIG